MLIRLALVAALLIPPSAALAQSPEPISRVLPPGVDVVRNLVYARYDDRELQLDLYRPSPPGDEALPVIVVIRGGGWRSGDKEGFGPIAAALAARRLAAVSIEYRASGEATFPAAVHDTKAAVRWVRANARAHGLDPRAVGAIGGSAGGHLAIYLGVTPGQGPLEGPGGNPDESSAISAIVGLAPATDFTAYSSSAAEEFLPSPLTENRALWEYASPVSHVSGSSPPALLIHSESDNVVPYEQSLQLANAYASNGVAVEVVLIPDAPHAFWNFTQWFEMTMDRAAAFFQRQLGG